MISFPKVLRHVLSVSTILFLLASFSFYVSTDGTLWIMWRDAPLLSMVFVLISVCTAAGWILSARRTRHTSGEETFQTTATSQAGKLSDPYNIWREMEPSVRRQMAAAVFLTFSTIGPITLLMQGSPVVFPLLTVIVKTVANGAMGASFILFGHRRVWLVATFAFFLTINIGVEPFVGLIGHTGAQRVYNPDTKTFVLSLDQQRDIAGQRTLLGAGTILLIVAGYVMWVVVLGREGNKRIRYQTVVSIAQDIQRKLLPHDVFRNSWCEAYGLTVPAEDVGGDYFDIIPLSEHQVAIVVADVAGHGIGAGILSTMTKSALRSQLIHDHSPVAVLNNLNSVIHQVAERKTFVTLAYALLDWKTNTARIATAGHPPVLHHAKRDGALSEVRTASMGLGMQENGVFAEAAFPIAKGDVLFLYTDGVVEASNERNEQFGMDRLKECILKIRTGSSHEVSTMVMNDIKEFIGNKPATDDATVVCVNL